ncbi:MAG: RnfABCDGE type electron transport complex subunit D [Xanthomonadales bacterium]|nr:RnfABCDGE type electron transport complex subunit D [Xanthomonadales bacterium]
MKLSRTLQIASSPHVSSGASVDHIMYHVVLALLPVVGFAVYAFGLAAALVIFTATASCVATEHFLNRLNRRETPVSDWSVTITGILYGLTLPPALPLWMVVIGGVFGVGIGKYLFGGLAYNAFNPALVGRAFLQAAFPQAMTHWSEAFSPGRFTDLPSSTLTIPMAEPVYDAVTSATPLAVMKFQNATTGVPELAFGLTSGSVGETCAALILAGGAYLALRNMLNWRIPVSILATVAGLSFLMNLIAPGEYASPVFMLFSGGLMLGAVFMATDMVASPITNAGCWLYGLLIGALVVVIRYWGGMPEGVMYAILLANAVSPHIDRLIQPTVFGTRPENGEKKDEQEGTA